MTTALEAESVRAAFRQCDREGQGLISRLHLERSLKNLNFPVDWNWIAGVLDECTSVDYERFIDLICGPVEQGLEEPQQTDMKVWLGHVKLDGKFPSREALHRLLYGSTSGSAEDADVIALFFTDLLIDAEIVESLRNMLSSAMGEERAAEYVFNESDQGLAMRHIPAKLVRATEEGARYVSMSVAVHRRNTRSCARESDPDDLACFPEACFLTCTSAQKNEFKPSFKSILAQQVVLECGGKVCDLLLLGCSLGRNENAKLGQLEALERMMKMASRSKPRFCALMWGNFSNHLVAFEELAPHIEERKALTITDAGVQLLKDWLMDPARRIQLLQKDSLLYNGRDVKGSLFIPPASNALLRRMFRMAADEAQKLPVPLPSWKQQSLDHLLSQCLGCRVQLRDIVCLDTISSCLASFARTNMVDSYFGWGNGKQQRKIRAEASSVEGEPPRLYMQLGWLDGVGVWKKSTAPAELQMWETDWDICAFDHLPLRSIVHVDVDGESLKVWLGFVKLDDRFPTQDALQHLLYGSDSASAEDADVIALFLTDLVIDARNTESLRHMLRRALGEDRGAQYIFNEEDRALLVRHIPAQLVKATEGGARYVSMSVCVHRRNVQDFDSDGDIDNFDCFPEPVYLTCKSARKNELAPSFKSILAQQVLLHCKGKVVDLLLLGANLDTDDEAKLGQLQALERLLRRSSKNSSKFCALIWGDFNNRLVAFDEMRPFVKGKKPGKYEITDAGAEFLVDMFKTPARRKELLQKDALVYTGIDMDGQKFSPPACCVKMRQMFALTVDADIQVPLPSYKVRPLEDVISKAFGCRLRLEDVVHIEKLRMLPLSYHLPFDTDSIYFGSDTHRELHEVACSDDPSKDAGRSSNLHLHLGWPDSVGCYKGSTAAAEIIAWETESTVLGCDHLPLRAVLSISYHSCSATVIGAGRV